MKLIYREIFYVNFAILLPFVFGHGRLLEPPSRTSMWRFGYNTPPDYDDNGHNCGGVGLQFGKNKGKCGMCGDPYYGPHDSEAGGIFAKGIITRSYKSGGIINVLIQITANHKGYFEFHLCPNNNIKERITQECLDKYPLNFLDGTSRHFLKDFRSNTNFSLSLRLPSHLDCSQCVLQWKYTAGNTYNCDPILDKCCTGCGDQEQFYACADISVKKESGVSKEKHPTSKQKLDSAEKETKGGVTSSQDITEKPNINGKMKCQAKYNLQPKKHFNKWCNLMCQPMSSFP
ncbi:uncharacterized protein LOC106877022 [Octopus bimaculoides]|uniref:Chitin-binding type-4 domain-containing protein n=1 Tax=Octopus bimaculoides TaxID=37653 RepID=A0A0L8GG90_OCTBM|nr:uncharacterized protein LOC106877022 [Octopus bimaculoides]XP_014781286.1 uncharacterized protein LOC106877022 [Octopus bimaculoides]XP_052830801.1 uncharacterized protein LOC106877022 [Octopus bimaculoides]XP_052830802.1 uncharacterized protein LOC106877022 [Octopus bimaculoides]|eukprot:XP_014781285.1 PREDICTED: uncharacterized protein LOC106877022 [Octopus bimaculoides]